MSYGLNTSGIADPHVARSWGGHREIDRTSFVDACRRDPRIAHRVRELLTDPRKHST
jgi:hypothetical protein